MTLYRRNGGPDGVIARPSNQARTSGIRSAISGMVVVVTVARRAT